MHPNAMPAAKAAVAAGKQGKFWEMHDLIFQNSAQLSGDKLKELATQVGLDVARWQKDLDAPDVQAAIDKDSADGRAANVQGTPTSASSSHSGSIAPAPIPRSEQASPAARFCKRSARTWATYEGPRRSRPAKIGSAPQ